MNKEQSNQMFGVDNIDAWLDDISCTHTFALGGKNKIAISLLSDAQEEIALCRYESMRRSLNRIKYLLDLDRRDEVPRRIVGKLMRYLESKGFKVAGVWDEEEIYKTDDPVVAMGHIFAVGEASLRVRKHGFGEHGILLIPGNGEDIISDWNYSVDDVDGFNAVMEAFTNPGD